MSRCAGVQNVSRPIDMCHEMSQYTPTITHAAAKTDGVRVPRQSTHGRARAVSVGEYAGRGSIAIAMMRD